MANLSTYISATCFRTADGHFHGWEGANNQAGCCFGNCTHVWAYESTTMHLFPSFSRSLREAAFASAPTTRVARTSARCFRPTSSAGASPLRRPDGYHHEALPRLAPLGDDAWLRKYWPAAKRAIEFSWIPGGWDADKDGVMEGCQHNTYDVEFFGPNPLCGVYYLGGLRASEEMARAVGDNASADTYRRLFEQGSKWIDANIFNGEYYYQKIQGIPSGKIAKGLTVGMGGADTEKPDFQVGDGCLVDQLIGQYLACVCASGTCSIRRTCASPRRRS